jgi:hypothetical protein
LGIPGTLGEIFKNMDHVSGDMMQEVLSSTNRLVFPYRKRIYHKSTHVFSESQKKLENRCNIFPFISDFIYFSLLSLSLSLSLSHSPGTGV